jgi:hypothetical protein
MESVYISIYMDKKIKSKLWALLEYTLLIFIIQWIFIYHSNDWRWVLFGIFFLLMNLFKVCKLLDIELQISISRKWYYILLIIFTIGFLFMSIKYLKF